MLESNQDLPIFSSGRISPSLPPAHPKGSVFQLHWEERGREEAVVLWSVEWLGGVGTGLAAQRADSAFFPIPGEPWSSKTNTTVWKLTSCAFLLCPWLNYFIPSLPLPIPPAYGHLEIPFRFGSAWKNLCRTELPLPTHSPWASTMPLHRMSVSREDSMFLWLESG